MTTNDDERVQPSPDDWQKLCEIEVLPEVLTEGAAKGARSRARERQCRRPAPSLSRWTARLGRVLPAVSASGVPFAAIQRPKARWLALFFKSSGVSCTLSSSFVVISEELVFRLRVAEKIMRPEL